MSGSLSVVIWMIWRRDVFASESVRLRYSVGVKGDTPGWGGGGIV